jgi:hypothetical protein
MNKPKTHVVILLDSSYSMGGGAEHNERQRLKKEATLNDFNEKVSMYKEIDEEDGQEILCSLVTFNNHYDIHMWNKPAKELNLAKDEDYMPNGGTAMWNAVGYTLSKIEEEVVPVLEEQDAVLVIVISDGEDNVAGQFRQHDVQTISKRLQATDQVTITYMGACQDVTKVARDMAIPLANAAQFSAEEGKDFKVAYDAQNKNSRSYFNLRKKGTRSIRSFCSKDNKVADYTQKSE